MPGDTWPVDTPVAAVLDRVRTRAAERRRRRHLRRAVLTAVTVVAAAGASFTLNEGASRLRTTPAEGSHADGLSGGTDIPALVGASSSGSAGRAASAGALPTVPSLPALATTTTTHAPATAGNGEIAFTRQNRIWLMHPDGSGLGPLSDPSHRLDGPDWSPDGRALVARDWQVNTAGANTISDLAIVHLDGTVQRFTDKGDYYNPKWSPDGSRIAFLRQESSTGPFDLWVVDVDGSHERKVVDHAGSIAWSPDGDRLAYNCDDGICVIDADGTDVRTVPDTWSYSMPAWSPNGQRLAVLGNGGLVTLKLDGSDQKAVAGGHVSNFDWSPDSRSIVFEEYDPGSPQPCVQDCSPGYQARIERVDADGSHRVTLTDGPADGDHGPTWARA